MLLELRIRDFAIIDQLELKFGPGFVAFTGETGAGKSIMIDAVELLMGGRAESTMVRTGTERALIEGTFRMDEAVRDELHAILAREEMLDDHEIVVLGREVRSQGRNLARINGRMASVGLLRELGEYLVDVHGQSEHLSLLRVPEHLGLLDRYAHTESPRSQYAGVYRSLYRLQTELKELRAKEAEAAQKIEFLTFQAEEINAAALEPDEEGSLQAERVRLANAEKLAELAELAVAVLDDGLHGGSSASDLIGQAVEALENLAEVDESMNAVRDEAQGQMEQLGELSRKLRVYAEGVEADPGRLDEVEDRNALINDLKRKYGGSIEHVIESGRAASVELETISNAEARLSELQAQQAELANQLGAAGGDLSQARQGAAGELNGAIENELNDLRMEGARFSVDFQWEDDPAGVPFSDRRVAFGPTGLDDVEFLVAPNPGEGLKPLVKVASGGETSRLMLGLKSVLAEADNTPTLIFDEIDQGIGGRVGAIVGRKLWRLASDHQVLCVTHLPQLAAFGDQHFKVDKVVHDGRTVTQVRQLDGESRTDELALMLGGVNDPNLESANELLRQADGEKAAAPVG